MNDAENLTKLLGHLPPAVFRAFMVDEFGLVMPELDAKKLKKEQREPMEATLSALGVSERQRIEDVAERIVLLSDGAGQDVIDGFKDDIFDDADREAFAAIPNQYQRASADNRGVLAVLRAKAVANQHAANAEPKRNRADG